MCAVSGQGRIERDRIALAEEVLRSTIVGTLYAVRRPPPPPRSRPAPRRPPERSNPLQPLARLFGREDEPQHPGPREQVEGARVAESRRPPAPTVHTPLLLQQVQAAFEAADRLLAAAEPPPPERVQVPWAEDRELVDLLHELLSAHAEQDGELALRHIARLKQDLALRHDIETVDFDGENDRYFSFGRNADPADRRITTVRPALVVSGRVARRGEVRGPPPTADGKERQHG
jgi:hypothetical protein